MAAVQRSLCSRTLPLLRSAAAAAAQTTTPATRSGVAHLSAPVVATARALRHGSVGRLGSCRGFGHRRWYSTENDRQVAGSRIWTFEEIKKLVGGEGSEVVIVDVREPSELHDTGIIPGAINIPITTAVQSFHVSEEDFTDMYGFERPSKDASLLFYCKAGVRARAAAGLAQHAGWKNVGEYPGSWLDWDAQKGPVEKVGGGKSGKGTQKK